MIISTANSALFNSFARYSAVLAIILAALAFFAPLSPLLLLGAVVPAVEIVARAYLGFLPNRQRSLVLFAAVLLAHAFFLALVQTAGGTSLAARLASNFGYLSVVLLSASLFTLILRKRLALVASGA